MACQVSVKRVARGAVSLRPGGEIKLAVEHPHLLVAVPAAGHRGRGNRVLDLREVGGGQGDVERAE
jgi:hypothetical protein